MRHARALPLEELGRRVELRQLEGVDGVSLILERAAEGQLRIAEPADASGVAVGVEDPLPAAGLDAERRAAIPDTDGAPRIGNAETTSRIEGGVGERRIQVLQVRNELAVD